MKECKRKQILKEEAIVRRIISKKSVFIKKKVKLKNWKELIRNIKIKFNL